jgi:secreted PhoX family phosphatase
MTPAPRIARRYTSPSVSENDVRRRTLLKVGGAALLALSPLPFLFDRRAGAPPPLGKGRALEPDPKRLLDLPEGFTYHVVDCAFDRMSDGYRVPGRPDGMACFAGPSGTLILMRNHECDRDARAGAYDTNAPPEAYDPKAYGAVTRVVLDEKGRRISSNLVLTGTMRNCAGGPSPWGWLTCEESVDPNHGYVFLCPTDASSVAPPRRLPAYGRFNHEAACVDPETLAVYLTEDRPDGCLYRFLPHDPARPFEGKLQALAIPGSPGLELREGTAVGTKRPISWVDLPDPDPKDDSLRARAKELGAALLCRGEGIWFGDGAVTICSTSGGANGTGQIFRLVPERAGQPGSLTLIAESQDEDDLDMPDNITLAPNGDLYLAEDGSGEQYIRALTRDGRLIDVARNAKSRGELAGVCFAPDGKTLFFNMQQDGVTVAVQGPFERLGRS